jgi:2-keto-4-pentenoate hydratase/2-oxohepta-3-ene-1,7-dioic acid hydratase in catechol pathway
MRFLQYETADGPRLAGRRDGGYVDLQAADRGFPTDLMELLAWGPDFMSRAREALRLAPPLPTPPARILAPILHPEKIVCIGLNYADHAAESGLALPTEPVVFCKFPTAISGPGDHVVLPEASKKVDYEAELVIVIGRGGRHIAPERALEHVAGYTCGHDVSARDWQLEKSGGQWLLGKSFDGFAPIGPELVTADEIGDAGKLDIALRLNGQMMQKSNTRQLIFPIEKLIAYVSTVCTLKCGDLIFTGTPPGVGAARKPPVFLKPGDVVEIEIEKIGVLKNKFVAPA